MLWMVLAVVMVSLAAMAERTGHGLLTRTDRRCSQFQAACAMKWARRNTMRNLAGWMGLTAVLWLTGCPQPSAGSECRESRDCPEDQSCLTEFKGGYCGDKDCTKNEDCHADAVCVRHDDGTNYCFLKCTDKPECNRARSAENESNCVSNVTLVEAGTNTKVCVPPSG